MDTIRYWFAAQSPWAWFGHERLCAIAARHGAAIEPRPVDFGRVFAASGGLPLPQRAKQRQAYRLVELQRWSAFLGVPLNLHPKHFPVAGDDASLLILAAAQRHGNEAATRLAGALMRAVWAEDRDIADRSTLQAIARECGFDGEALSEAREAARPLYEQYTQQAIDAGVFGAPWYEFRGEPFWGQDRLDLLDRALARARSATGTG
ncbi:MAG TPA: 2-hydroxychromene-2-carboxylate isomerase [Burkholderiaceae bacterium]|nr:2-hydroxychromene-2-carboxylate isomerase [Burkholderiaceae bacterium]